MVLDDHPVTRRLEDIIFLCDHLEVMVQKIERRIRRRLFFFISLFSVATALPIACWTYQSWDRAEPIFFIIQGFAGLALLLVIISSSIIPDKITFINRYRERIINWRFRRMGVDRHKLKAKLDALRQLPQNRR